MEVDDINEVLRYIVATGSTQTNTTWPNVKMILSQKIKNIEKDFVEPAIDDIPQYPNVDNFNFDLLKTSLLDRLELFVAPPFTIQRMCELLLDPKKQYSRIDKFMRALEKNILVVSTVTDNGRRQSENEFRDNFELTLNGTDSVEIAIEAKVLDQSESTEETENKFQASPKEINFHRLDDDVDEDAPSPKKIKLDSDIVDEKNKIEMNNLDENEHIVVDKSTERDGIETEQIKIDEKEIENSIKKNDQFDEDTTELADMKIESTENSGELTLEQGKNTEEVKKLSEDNQSMADSEKFQYVDAESQNKRITEEIDVNITQTSGDIQDKAVNCKEDVISPEKMDDKPQN